MDWDTLLNHDYKKIRMIREPHIEELYQKNKSKYINYDDNILNSYLSNKLYNLQPNKYPYHLSNNIKHCVLWLNPMLKSEYIYDKKNIYNILKKEIKNKEFYFYMNSPNIRSVRIIPYYQVFIKL